MGLGHWMPRTGQSYTWDSLYRESLLSRTHFGPIWNKWHHKFVWKMWRHRHWRADPTQKMHGIFRRGNRIFWAPETCAYFGQFPSRRRQKLAVFATEMTLLMVGKRNLVSPATWPKHFQFGPKRRNLEVSGFEIFF